MAAGRKGSITVVDENVVGVTSVFAKSGEHAILEEGATADEVTLGALGYKQEFKRYSINHRTPPYLLHSDPTICQRLHHMGILFRFLLGSRSPAIHRLHHRL